MIRPTVHPARAALMALPLCATLGVIAQTAPQQGIAPVQTTATAQASTSVQEGGVPTYVKSETPEERRQRVGPEDPGPDPDPEKLFYRFGQAFHISKFDKQWAEFSCGVGCVKPFKFANFQYEVYQVNDKYVWVWVLESPPQPAPQTAEQKAVELGLTDPQIRYFKWISKEFSELNPPNSKEVLRFEESSEGLPKNGSWRNAAAFADMNGDGNIDIVAPAQRTGDGIPAIFLGDGKGHWKEWETLWPYRMDYGSATVADFNKDGKMDVAFGVHLQGVRALFGDGKGKFTDASKGLSISDFPTRRVIAADFDRDGYPDIAAISEGPTGAATAQGVRSDEAAALGKLRVFHNDAGKGWSPIVVATGDRLIAGDYLAAPEVNGDRYPDMFGSSIFYQGTDTVYLSNGKMKWKGLHSEGDVIPFLSYFYAMTYGRFASKKTDDVLVSFVRFWPEVATSVGIEPKLQSVAGLDRLTMRNGKLVRSSVMRFPAKSPISGMSSADFNGDGKLDVMFTRYEPREFVLLLGDGKGGFTRAKLEGLTPADQPNYDIIAADVNGDGRTDLAVMYEANDSTGGSIRVYLNRGKSTAKSGAVKAEK